MSNKLGAKRLNRLDVQGFDAIGEDLLAQVGSWLRLAFGLCATLAIIGTALASQPLLLALAGIAFVASLSPVHPFDLIYNLGIRHVTRTPPLPRRGPPNRFACGVGALWLIVTVGAFQLSWMIVGYVLGFALAFVAILVATADICIPSMIFRAMLGGPRRRKVVEDASETRSRESQDERMPENVRRLRW
jgi:hypothetical protein